MPSILSLYLNNYMIYRYLFEDMPFCTACQSPLTPDARFCGQCSVPVSTSNDSIFIDERLSTASPVLGPQSSSNSSNRKQSSKYSSSKAASSLTSEVRSQKAFSAKEERSKSKDQIPVSSYGVDPRGKITQQRTAEVYTVEQGHAPIRLPGAFKKIKLLPQEIVEDWSEWAREQVRGFSQWQSRLNPDIFVEDYKIAAFVGICSSSGPIELELEPGAALATLLCEVPDEAKSRIALIIPIRNLAKEEGDMLLIPPANKRAKSPSGAAVPKRGSSKGKGKTKEAEIKLEVVSGDEAGDISEQEVKVEIKDEEGQSDSEELPELVSLFGRKRKPNRRYR